MRAPADKRSDEEIVGDIMGIMKVANVAGFVIGKQPNTRIQSIKPYVLKLISDLRADLPPVTGNRKQNAAFAKKLRKQIDGIELILKAAPNSFLVPAVFGDRFWSLWGRPEVMFEFNPQARKHVEQAPRMRIRLERFRADLRHMRSRCNDIIALQLGAHGHLNHQHVHAALAARTLLETAANFAGTKARLGCSPTGRFCRVASLFHEAATGEYDADLQRACKAVA